MSLSYTPHECREFYRESKYKGKAFAILMDMNPYAKSREMKEVLGIKTHSSCGIRPDVIRAIKRSKYPALYAHIVQTYGSMRVFCEENGINTGTLFRFIRGGEIFESTRDIILHRAGMTFDEAQKEWNPCMEKDTAKA